MYISRKTHAAGARGHLQHEQQASYPCHSRTSACTGPGRAEGETGNPLPKTTGNGGNPNHLRTGNSRVALSTPRTHTCQPWGTEESRRDNQTTAKPRTHWTEAGNSPSQATPWAVPTEPADTTPRVHGAQPADAKPEKTAHQDHAATDGPEEKTPQTHRHKPLPEKRQASGQGDTDTTRTGRDKNERRGGVAVTKGTTA